MSEQDIPVVGESLDEVTERLNANRLEALEILFVRIQNQQADRGVLFHDMTTAERQRYASDCGLALFVEVGELMESFPFVSWKTYDTDIPNIEREIIDCVIFLVNIASCFGISPKALTNRFDVVLANNKRRIESGEHKEVY